MDRRILLKRKQASRLEIIAPEEYSGKSLKVSALYNGAQCAPVWSIVNGSEYATINSNGKITINQIANGSDIVVQAIYKNRVEETTIEVTYAGDLQLVCPDTITGSSGTYYVLYDGVDVTENASYEIISGDADIPESGSITFDSTGVLEFTVGYDNVSTSKSVMLIYNVNTTTETVIDPETGDTTTTTTTEVTDPTTGETTTTQTVVTENTNGSSTTTQTETVTQEDGSSETNSTTTNSDGTSTSTTTTTSTPDPETGAVTTESTTTNYNENGDPTSSSETTLVENTDGSSTSQTTNYNSEGDPTSTQNQETDTDGNESVQNITYDSNGDPIVSGYNIDTTNNPDGEKNFNEEGVNTEFYGFDSVDGFIMRIHFTIDFTDQPPNQNEGHHNILTMKRASPSPWYGFQLRHSNTNKNIILGTQFELGSNTNTTINPSWVVSNQIGEYDIQVVYDPTLFQNTFVCTNLLNGNTIYSSSSLFPDLPELRYLTVCIGCALDENGDPYRYSNINVLDFELNKIQRELTNPLVTCDGQTISLSCLTPGSKIYYRLNHTGSFVQYTEPISIYNDTVVQTYSTLYDQQSETVTQLCVYDDGLEEPVINCDGESVDISCATPSVDIYYRLGTSGSWTLYESPIEINATTVVQAYSEINSHQSDIVEETCVYVPVVLAAPVISYADNVIEISCSTIRAQIHYRLNQEGTFLLYEEPITITEDTYIEAYSTYKNQTSSTVDETCIYVPAHDYSQDYLTFRVLTSGTILWKAIGSLTKTIEYSINNGSWTSLTSTTAGAAIYVSENDVVRLRGNNTTYATSKSAYSGFDGGTATYDIEGNIHSLLYGDNFASNSSLTNSTYQFCSIFKQSGVHSAENLILPALSLTKYCYRAMFSKATSLIAAPALPATTLSEGCYYYMFEECAFETAPDLLATTIAKQSYYYMFTACHNLNFIRCLATSGVSTTNCQGWTNSVSGNGIFIKDDNTTWTLNSVSGIPIGWTVYNDVLIYAPDISFDGETIELSCQTPEMDIYYRLDGTGNFLLYSSPIIISQDTDIEAYATDGTHNSPTSTMSCIYVEESIYEQSNKDLTTWTFSGNTITTPYSVNRIDGHSSNYAKGTFNFETTVNLRSAQPTYLWFQHADQSADIYVDNMLVETHWGGYNAFFSDISNYIHRGTNHIKVVLCNTTRSTLAPAAGDFNFNATLGNVKLFTSPYIPDMKYGYDGMHITSSIVDEDAIVTIKTKIPTGADVYLTITDGETTIYSTDTQSDGDELTFSTTITNVHLWNGTLDPHLYDITLDIYADGELYHTYTRPYGFRTYEYVINKSGIVQGENYTGFLLNGSPYLLRGVCMHDDLDGKANALNDADYNQEFSIIQELGCNFIRLAHYPHPKEVYDRCDRLGIIVQTEVPCVNKLQSTMPADYYTHLTGQYRDMVNQHYNHPCIMFWGLSNETSTDDKAFGKSKVEEYTSLIKSLDQERWVGYVLSHSYNNPLGYYNDPAVDWVGGNIYVGWYIDKASNDPTSQLNTRINNTINRASIPFAFSEYGCGGTPTCHSDNFLNTTTTGNYARHDIEYQMWLHEGHIAAIRNFPQLMFTAQWQLFDIAVSNRNEGYTECFDGETTSTNDALRRLNNKGLVERDHVHKKDTFYIYKAEWNSDPFVHVCGKNYTKMEDRVIKAYTNAGNSASLYVNDTLIETVSVSDHIILFTDYDFNSGDVVRVNVGSYSDTFTFA